MGMSKWISLNEKKPSRKQICDFILSGNENEPLVWMLCSALLADIDAYEFTREVMWRPADPLPDGITEWGEAYDNLARNETGPPQTSPKASGGGQDEIS